jgi:hypothetical protein
VHSAFSRHNAHEVNSARTGMTSADVTERLASLDVLAMPAHLAARVADAITAESACRQVVPAR